MDTLSGFIKRCDDAAGALRIKRSTLSTLLFNDGKRIGQLANGGSDVGVRRLAEADRFLVVLVAERLGHAS